jgi:tetratricopeptide (TPR) repeat protein
VALCFPLAFWLRTRAAYRRYGLALGSELVGAIGLVWSLERALDVSWTARVWGGKDTPIAATREHRRHGHQPEVAADLAALARTHLGTASTPRPRPCTSKPTRSSASSVASASWPRTTTSSATCTSCKISSPPPSRCREALGYSEQAEDTTEAANNWANLAGVYRKQAKLGEARQMYEKSLSLFEQSGAKSKALRVRSLLASLEQPSAGPLRQ